MLVWQRGALRAALTRRNEVETRQKRGGKVEELASIRPRDLPGRANCAAKQAGGMQGDSRGSNEKSEWQDCNRGCCLQEKRKQTTRDPCLGIIWPPPPPATHPGRRGETGETRKARLLRHKDRQAAVELVAVVAPVT